MPGTMKSWSKETSFSDVILRTRRKKAVLNLIKNVVICWQDNIWRRLSSPPYGGHRQLKSRRPFVPAALELLNDLDKTNTSAAHWADYRWSMEWLENTSWLYKFIADVNSSPHGINFPRSTWVKLNRLQSGVGSFRFNNLQMGYDSFSGLWVRRRGADHVLKTCPIYSYPNGL